LTDAGPANGDSEWMNCGCLNHNKQIKGGPRVPVPVTTDPSAPLQRPVS
jgi:hypothetical protein